MTEKERMLSGNLYSAADTELRAIRAQTEELLYKYNNTLRAQADYRRALLEQLFAGFGQNSRIKPSFKCDYGYNITIGDNFFANYDCIILDVAKVKIGHNVLFGPRVSLFTASHPIDAAVRNSDLEYGLPITIGDNCWLGGNVTVLAGITIGDNVVVGAGSVVTKDIPSNVIAVGNPCKILCEITSKDQFYWQDKKREYEQS
ncbi:MAG: sugar O-acetyltransferase [Spirochaetaceae bacterium]|nr:sugar O-acetyltransferase [Spirochaetaceae bacterium]